ncbi:MULTISPECIES: hypothetical protein [unclassified Streptomyces]|uniref:hypothetical protein n=1 Tax=unclassified Streptomyces TaxID=2593676 RepID=UPI0023EB4B8F|nr:hypothetical protein [Streptomyces sp. WMMB303]MDF4252599.1 hypothetical protein [Streptomyces sp. WMMB303]
MARAATVAAGVATLTMAGLTGSASASADAVRQDVCFVGACGSATVSFHDKYRATVSMSVADTKCDGHAAKVRIKARQYSYSNQTWYTYKGPWHYNKSGCHGGYKAWNGLGFRGEDPTSYMTVEICNDGVYCRTSGALDSPYY